MASFGQKVPLVLRCSYVARGHASVLIRDDFTAQRL